jgi:hypothetical protein
MSSLTGLSDFDLFAPEPTPSVPPFGTRPLKAVECALREALSKKKGPVRAWLFRASSDFIRIV